MSEAAVSFDAVVGDDGQIRIPQAELDQVHAGQSVHVHLTLVSKPPLRSSRGRLKHLASTLGTLDIDGAREEMTREADRSLAEWGQ